MKTLIKGGRVLDPASKTDAVKDVLFEDGVILKVAENITDDAENVIDADGMFVMPGLIDLHVHFREPALSIKRQSVQVREQLQEVDLQRFVPCLILSLLLTVLRW